MTERIPLWIDLTDVPAHARADVEEAAAAAGCEQVGHGHGLPVHRVANGTEQQAAMNADGPIAVDADDWTIIPLENLIAARRNQPGTLFAVARNPDEAVRFRDTLEVGVHGIVLRPTTAHDVVETDRRLRERGPRLDDATSSKSSAPQLVAATITRMEDAGPAERVCIDCTERFEPGEGLLIGSTARGFVLVHAETMESEFVAPRPFRVNAGAVHSYLLGPDGRTQYLSEIAAGARVLAVRYDGNTREMTVGRAKIEHRPHTLVAWTTDDGVDGNAILQTAETVRLLRPDGEPMSVTDLAVGDTIQVHVDSAARHFGMPVHETLREQ